MGRGASNGTHSGSGAAKRRGAGAGAFVPAGARRRHANRDLPEPAQDTPPPRRILSIDGGGIRGIIPAVILAEIEQRTGKPTAELFDMVAGTSTGAIIALALTTPGPDGKPLWRAKDLVELYEKEGPKIFHRSLLRRAFTASGVLAPKYSRRKLDQALEQYLGDTELQDAMVDVLVPAAETRSRQPFFFRSERARRNAAKNFKMRDVARAATAAPTYFAPVALTNEVSGREFSLIDGGVFANNPALCAFADLDRYGDTHDIMMLSLGTGTQTESLPYDRVKGWGLRGWAPQILDVVFDNVSKVTDYQLWEMLGDDRYLRLQTTLDQASDKMDQASRQNIAALKAEARQVLDTDGDLLMEFIDRMQTFGDRAPAQTDPVFDESADDDATSLAPPVGKRPSAGSAAARSRHAVKRRRPKAPVFTDADAPAAGAEHAKAKGTARAS